MQREGRRRAYYSETEDRTAIVAGPRLKQRLTASTVQHNTVVENTETLEATVNRNRKGN